MTNTAAPSATPPASPSLPTLGDRDLHRQLYRRARRRVRLHEDAEDIAQETLLKAWRHREGFNGLCSLKTWLYHIEDGCISDFYKRSQCEREGRYYPSDDDGEPIEFESPAASPLRLLESAERLAAAWGVAITERERKALKLQCEDGLSVGEIAAEMRTTEGTVRVTLCRARHKLRAA